MDLSGDLSGTEIESARLVLRAITDVDAAEAFEHLTASIARYMEWNLPEPSEFAATRQALLSDIALGANLHLAIRMAGTGEFVGMAGLHPASGTMLEAGLWLKESAQGCGYGQEAIAALIAWAGGRYRPSGFLWPVVEENLPSRRLVERLGGTISGERFRTKPGDMERKVLLYEITRSHP